MHQSSELRILFPTSFSDACFRTSRALAQLADRCRVNLTIAHVAGPGKATPVTRQELHSFLAEADHYDCCERVLLESSDPVSAIADFANRERFDLVMAPASDRLGLQSLFGASFRARLLKQCSVPLWTAGPCLDRVSFKQPVRSVACLMDFDSSTDSYLQLVAAFAERFGAKLRVLHVVPPVDEGTLLRSLESSAPLMPGPAMRRIQSAFRHRAVPDIHISIGEESRELPRLLNRCEADLLFVGPGQALRGIIRPRLKGALQRLPCPVVCVDGAASGFTHWSFQLAAEKPSKALVPSPEYSLAS